MSFDKKKIIAQMYSNFLIHNRYGSFGALVEPERQKNLAWCLITSYNRQVLGSLYVRSGATDVITSLEVLMLCLASPQ